eukprot:c28811_g1_i1 orf=707-2356(-)
MASISRYTNAVMCPSGGSHLQAKKPEFKASCCGCSAWGGGGGRAEEDVSKNQEQYALLPLSSKQLEDDQLLPLSGKELDDNHSCSAILRKFGVGGGGAWLPSCGFVVSAAGGLLLGLSIAFVLVLFRENSAHGNSFAHTVVPDDWGTSRSLGKLDSPVVILISSDGFRWGYNLKVPTPNLDRLRLNGTEAEPGMIPVYPTLTFPNHYSIATGLYPAWHGIIGNSFSNPNYSSNDKFYQGNIDPKWWLGEPLWQTVVKNGLKAATYFWPGSDVSKGVWNCTLPYCRHYNGSVPYEERVDTILGYFDLPPSQRPSFITLYFEEPDHTGHTTGPDDPHINEAVSRIDGILGRLINGLEQRGVFDDVTLILVGDHGMVSTCDKKLIFLEDFSHWLSIPPRWVDSVTPVLAIRPPPGVDLKGICTNITMALNSGKVRNGQFLKVYLKEDLPARLHYSVGDRIQPIIGIVDEGYKMEKKSSNIKECGGAHGYDNEHLSMRTIFIGHGPQFARGRKIPSFINVELYNVIVAILGVTGAPNNGSESFANTVLLTSQK